jgi:hypothetical protein
VVGGAAIGVDRGDPAAHPGQGDAKIVMQLRGFGLGLDRRLVQGDRLLHLAEIGGDLASHGQHFRPGRKERRQPSGAVERLLVTALAVERRQLLQKPTRVLNSVRGRSSSLLGLLVIHHAWF